MNSDSTISHLTGGLRQPCSIEAAAILRMSASGRSRAAGVKPTSCMSRKATTNITASTTPRSTNGTPRLVWAAMKPPATEPDSMPAPVTI